VAIDHKPVSSWAGEVVTTADSSVTFRLKGTPGERIAFTFDKK